MIKTIYSVPAPYSMTSVVEVYGDPDNGWYEFRLIDSGRVVFDTGTFQGREYGNSEIALRDALVHASGGAE